MGWPSTVEFREWLGPNHASGNDPLVDVSLGAAVGHLSARLTIPAAIPDDLRMAALILGAALYKRQTTPDGTAGFSEVGIVRTVFNDPHVKMLVGPYRRLPGMA